MTTRPSLAPVGRTADRLRLTQVNGPTDSTIADWLQLIRAEYLEMPRLRLTRLQAQRLWALDPSTCDALLTALVNVGFLTCTRDERYVLTEGEW